MGPSFASSSSVKHYHCSLQRRKGENINRIDPQVVAAGNIGCIEQIARVVDAPVVHTAQLLDWATGGPTPPGIGDAPTSPPPMEETPR